MYVYMLYRQPLTNREKNDALLLPFEKKKRELNNKTKTHV